MAVTAKVYGPSMLSMWNKQLDWDSDTIQCLLLTSVHTPNQDTHRYRADLSNEVTGAGYTAGGVTLTGKTIAYDTATNKLTLDSDDPVFTVVTLAAVRYAVFYGNTGSSATSPLISYIDFGADSAPTSQDFRVALPVGGIATYTAA